MLFGQSLFQSVLERLKAESIEEEEADGDVRAYRIQGLGASFIAEEIRGATTEMQRGQALYREMMESPPPIEPEIPEPEPEPQPPAHLLRQTPDEIAADLGLKPNDTIAVLAEKRRAFARLNHPDSIEPAFRDMANMRMQLANLLVDEAIRLQQA